MDFIIKETGERRSVEYVDIKNPGNGDYATEIARNNGLLEDSSVSINADGSFTAPREVVEFWADYFDTLAECDKELEELRQMYDSEEVERIYFTHTDGVDIDEIKYAVKSTREILQNRYDIAFSQLIGSYSPDLPQNDARYFNESLYQQYDDTFFFVGEGGPMTRYHSIGADGLSFGRRVYPATKKEAHSWAAEHCCKKKRDEIFGA